MVDQSQEVQGARPLSKTIALDALLNNWRRIRALSQARRIYAVIKSNAYGHGLLRCADALADCADGFALIDVNDAVRLRRHGIESPLLLMQGVFDAAQLPLLAEYRLTPAVHSEWQLRALATLPVSARLTVQLKINIGMNRLGFAVADTAAALATLRQTPAVRDIVLMTHFADADTPDGLRQPLHDFAPLREKRLPLSLGNSAATLLHGDIGDDIARVGIALYGASPAPDLHSAAALRLRPVMTFSTALIAVQQVAAGGRIGYGGTFTAPSNMRVGIASVGYGDGYPRREGLVAAIAGTRVPLLGRVSMEMIALDLTATPTAKIGDQVELWGATLPVDEVAKAAGTIAYDMLTSVNC